MASEYHTVQLISRGKIMMLTDLKLFNVLIQPIFFESLVYTRLNPKHYTKYGEQS